MRSSWGALLCWCFSLHGGSYLTGCYLFVKLLFLCNSYRSLRLAHYMLSSKSL